MSKIYASDLEQLLTLIEEETQNKERFPDRLRRKIANEHLNIPKRIIRELIAVSKILATPSKISLGKMIVVTGLDKSGKETQAFNPERSTKITSIYDYLLSKSYRVLKISLPSYKNTFGSLVAAYLGKEDSPFLILGELPEEVAWILWSLDRAQHNPEVEGWLNASPFNVVLSKRWTETSIVYQKTKGIKNERILKLERNIIKPAYTFVIDVSPEIAFERMRVSREKPDRYETMEFLMKVREDYTKLHEYYPFGKIFYFDGSGSPERVNKELLEKLSKLGF